MVDEDASPAVLYWEGGRGDFLTPPYALPDPVPNGLAEPQPHPTWIEEVAQRGGEMFVPHGNAPNQTCLRWTFRGSEGRAHATSDAFVAPDSQDGVRTIRLVYSVHAVTDPMTVLDRIQRRIVVRVEQMSLHFSGPRIQEQDPGTGRYTNAEEHRCDIPYALVGGDDVFVKVVPTMMLLRAYSPEMERHWYRTLDACEAAVARGPAPGSMLCD